MGSRARPWIQGAAWLLVLGHSAGTGSVQEPEEPVWRFGNETVSVQALVDLCSNALGRVIEYDPTAVSGEVYLSSATVYTKADLWALLNRELASREATTVQPPGSDSLRIVPIGTAAGLARLEEPDLAGAQAGFVKVLVPLEHRSAEAIEGTVAAVLSVPHGKVSVVEGAILIADFLTHAEQALFLIELVDRREIEPVVEEFKVKYLSPIAVGALLERLVSTREKVLSEKLRGSALPLPESKSVLVVAPGDEMPWWRQMVDRFDRPEPVRTEQYVPRRFGLEETAALIEEVVHGGLGAADPGWRMVQDELTGTLIITASPTEHVEIQALLDRLEGTELGPRKPLRAFTLKNRQVSEVLALLQGLLDAGVLNEEELPAGEVGEGSVRGATGVIPTATRPVRPVQGEIGTSPVSLAADEGSNRILAFGPASLLDQVGGLVETLDVRNAQVLVETLVLVLNEDETKALGVELQALRHEGDTLVGLASLFGLGSPDPTSLALPAASGSGFSTTVLDPGDFSAVLRTLETLGKGRSLTVPKVLVNNNAEARLDSTLQTPYASTNASTTVATTSFGGTFDAGTAISVKPQVADGDLVVIDYTVSLSRFTGESADPTLPPPRQETKLQSTVTVPDGHTIVIGGLEIESESDTVSEVPILGDLPIVEHLFQDRSRTKGKSRFYVFVKCSVMRSGSFEDLKYESGEVLAAMDVDDGWPKLEPRVIR